MQLINLIEKYTDKKAIIEYLPSFPEDMESTYADIDKAKNILHWKPATSLEEGIQNTVNWMYDNWEWVKEIKL